MLRFPKRLSFQLTISLVTALLLVMTSIAWVSARYQEDKVLSQVKAEMLSTTKNVGLALSLLIDLPPTNHRTTCPAIERTTEF